MKNLITVLIFIVLSYSVFAVTPDTTGQRDRGTTTKEKIRKDGTSGGGSSSDYSGSEDSFTDQCLTSCAWGFLEAIFSGDASSDTYSGEPDIAHDNYTQDTSAALRNKTLQNDDQSADIKHYTRTIWPPGYRIYLNAGIAGEYFTGEIAEEYLNSTFSYRFSSTIFMKNFIIALYFSRGFVSGKPLYDYKTTYQDASGSRIIKDIPTSAKISNTSFSLGAGYMFDVSDYWGFELSAGGVYHKIEEKTELIREEFLNGIVRSSTADDNLNFSGFYPYIRTGAYLYTNDSASFMLNVFLQYIFINREPQYKESTPMDWSKVSGEFIYGLGLSFNIL
jgi:hypothetical protein